MTQLLGFLGLPQMQHGFAGVTAAIAVLLTSIGLVVLRITRPSAVSKDLIFFQRSSARYAAGAFGATVAFVGLVLMCSPMLPGAVSDQDATQARLIRCLLVPVLWAAERFWIQRKSLPPLQSFWCAWIFIATALYEYGAPRPWDNVSMTLNEEVMGCSGGYRFWFQFYMAAFATGTVFGSSLLATPDTSKQDADTEAATNPHAPSPSRLRRKLGPFLYGAAVSGTGVAFNVGVTSDRVEPVVTGCVVLFIGLLYAWDWLWRQELSLCSWAPVSQLFVQFVAYLQAVCVFQDLRWAPDHEHGFFAVPQNPGVWAMAVGVAMFFLSFPIYIVADDSIEFMTEGDEEITQQRITKREQTHIAMVKVKRPARTLALIIFPFCMAFIYLGATRPMFVLQKETPQFMMASDDATTHTTTTTTVTTPSPSTAVGKGFIYLLPAGYNRKMPLTSFVVITNCLSNPVMLALHTLILLARPVSVPDHFMKWCRNSITGSAKGRFINPMVSMLGVAWINFWDPASGSMNVDFGPGFWFMVLHAFTGVLLAVAMEVDAEKLDRFEDAVVNRSAYMPIREGIDPLASLDEIHQEGLREDPSVDVSSDPIVKHVGWQRGMAAVCGYSILVLCVTYVALINPFLIIQVRIGGIMTNRRGATALDLWHSLMDTSAVLGVMASSTILFAMLVWVPVVILSLRPSKSRLVVILEKIARQGVMGPHWAFAMLFLYILLSMHAGDPGAMVQVCYEFPVPPIGPMAILFMGIGVGLLQALATAWMKPLAPQKLHQPGGIKIPPLPGGLPLWVSGLTLVFISIFMYLHISGPVADTRLSDLADVNAHFASALSSINGGLASRMPESLGDCEALRRHRRQLKGHIKRRDKGKCIGSGPVANTTSHGFQVAARWVTGLDTLEVTDVKAFAPSDPTAGARRWRFVIDGMFTDLNVWMKVDLVATAFGRKVFDEVWVDGNMCCDGATKFTLQATADCTEDDGFHKVSMGLPYLDVMEFDRTGNTWSAVAELEQARMKAVHMFEEPFRRALVAKLDEAFRVNADNLRVRTRHEIINPVVYISKMMEQALVLNTGHRCPH